MGKKHDMARRHGGIGRRRGNTEEGKGRRQFQLAQHESYWAKKCEKFMRPIQLLQMDGEDLEQ
jgi:hypothetical protein